jgi:hypothetical protein
MAIREARLGDLRIQKTMVQKHSPKSGDTEKRIWDVRSEHNLDERGFVERKRRMRFDPAWAAFVELHFKCHQRAGCDGL